MALFVVRTRRLFPIAYVALLSILVATLAACQDDAGVESPPVSTSTLRAPSSTTSSINAAIAARDKAIAAYRGMWAAYEKAAQDANPDDPALATYATDTALQTLVSGLKSIHDRGLVARGQIVVTPQVTALEPVELPTNIEITDCADDSASLLYRTSGELYNDKPGGRRRVIATAKDVGGGVWKVVSFGAQAVGTC